MMIKMRIEFANPHSRDETVKSTMPHRNTFFLPKISPNLPAGTNDLAVGMNRSSPEARAENRSFGGAVDDLMIFNHALSGDEVQAVIDSIKPKFTKAQVARRLAEIKELYDRGLLTKEFYDRKVAECEVAP